MDSSLQVIGIGHVTCDIVCPLDGWPAVDSKTLRPGITLAGGGPTANTMAALARLGVPSGLVGQLGADLLGRFSLEAHQQAGVDVSHLFVEPTATSPVSVLLTDVAAGTRTILLTKGERTEVDPAALDMAWLAQARVLHLDGHQLHASRAAAQAARTWPGTQVLLDAGSLREGMLELAGMADVVIASRRFVREFAGTDEPNVALAALSQLGAAMVVGMTCGVEGSFFMEYGAIRHQPAFHTAVQDTTGAGDAFQAGYIYGMLQDWPLALRLEWASAVAALKCRGLGARSTLPSVSETLEFLQSMVEAAGSGSVKLFCNTRRLIHEV